MAKQVRTNPADFKTLENYIKEHDVSGRTKSASMLLWFLVNIYRLDETDAQDAVCDRSGDEGIDALVVNDDQEEVIVFQAKRRETANSTLGDSDLRHFVGSMTSIQDADSIRRIENKTKNADLRRLLRENDIATKIDNGYRVSGVFVTNIAANDDATAYLTNTSSYYIDLWDLTRIGPVLRSSDKTTIF
jgi:hypothetical protein